MRRKPTRLGILFLICLGLFSISGCGKKGDPKLLPKGEGGIRYTDSSVRIDHFYVYRVASCNSRGDCGPASNAVQGIDRGQ